MGDIEALRGVWNIVPTPFLPDGALDTDSIPRLVEFVRATGVDGHDDPGRARRGGAARRRGAHHRPATPPSTPPRGSIPICVGVSHASTDRAIAYAREAEAAGAHSVMLAPPPLARPTDAAIRRHYLAVASAIAIPVVVQDHPASSGVQMSVDFLLAIAAEAPSCRVIKLEEEPTPAKTGRLVDGSPDVIVLGGLGGQMLLEELRHGSHGTMTGFGFPEILVAVVRRWFAGDREGAAALFDRYATVDPVREPGDPQPRHPQGRLPAAGRDRPFHRSGARHAARRRHDRRPRRPPAADGTRPAPRGGFVHGRRLT